MSFEKQKNTETAEQQESQEKFDSAFWNEVSENKKDFKEITSWASFDDKLSPEENFKSAFDSKINTIIDKELANLPENQQHKVEELKQKAETEFKNWDVNELCEAFKEIKAIAWTFNAEKSDNPEAQKNNIVKEWENNEKKNQDFMDELRELMAISDKDYEKQQNKKIEQIAVNNNLENNRKNNIDKDLAFSFSEAYWDVA